MADEKQEPHSAQDREQEEPSVVTMLIHEHKKGTSVELRHTGIPEEAYDDIVEGWNEVYFKSLEEFYS